MSRIAAIQTSSSDDIGQNLLRVEKYIFQAAEQGASVVVLPECFAFMQRSKRQLLEHAESDSEGRIQRFVGKMARQSGLWIFAGSIPLHSSHPGKVTNSMLVFDDTGTRVGRYDKIFLFDVELDNGERYRESDYTVAGGEMGVIDSPVGKIGLSICYDLRFPEMYRRLTQLGAQILVVPSAFSYTTGISHWLPLLQARAIENSCYVVAPAQTGIHNNRRKTWGHTVVIEPWGQVVSELEQGWGLVCAEIDLARLDHIRQQLPSHSEFHPDIFRSSRIRK
ncbi:MAG: carbon-nitrogen hydrolase family protein [Gammaproteobacteria bacterium]|nr:carbon-nitrogen hydrolase family protein [Gammaproteobacteria bacterium]